MTETVTEDHSEAPPMPAARRRAARAFTLIEAVAALVVLGIAVPPVIFAVQSAHVQRANPVLASRARWLATEKLEDVMADRHSTTRGWDHLVPASYPAEATVAGFPGYSRTVTLAETGPDLVSPGSGYMTVRVDVSWTDAAQTGRTLSVTTVLVEGESS